MRLQFGVDAIKYSDLPIHITPPAGFVLDIYGGYLQASVTSLLLILALSRNGSSSVYVMQTTSSQDYARLDVGLGAENIIYQPLRIGRFDELSLTQTGGTIGTTATLILDAELVRA